MAPQNRQKPLSPTLKEKKRYLSYRLISAHPLPSNAGALLVVETKRILGVFDAADAGVMGISYDPKTQQGVMRVSLKKALRVQAALLLITSISSIRMSVRLQSVSGVLGKAKDASGIPKERKDRKAKASHTPIRKNNA